jgi:hypothetical protein
LTNVLYHNGRDVSDYLANRYFLQQYLSKKVFTIEQTHCTTIVERPRTVFDFFIKQDRIPNDIVSLFFTSEDSKQQFILGNDYFKNSQIKNNQIKTAFAVKKKYTIYFV